MDKLLSKKWIYIVAAIFTVYFLRKDQMILNLPSLWNFKLYCATLFCIILFICYYNFKNKLKSGRFTQFLVSIFISFFCFMILKTGINFYLVEKSKSQPVNKIVVDINHYKSRNKATSHWLNFSFKGKDYSLLYVIRGLNREDIMKNYNLEISIRKSVLDTYVVEKYNIVKK